MAITYARKASDNLTVTGPTSIYSGPAVNKVNYGWVLTLSNKAVSIITATVFLNDGTADRQIAIVELDASGGYANIECKQAIGNGHSLKVGLSGTGNVDYYLSAFEDDV